MAEASCKFRRPVQFPDNLITVSNIDLETLEDDCFHMSYRMYSEKLGLEFPVAKGDSLIVGYNYRQNKRSNFPQEFLDSIVSSEKELLLEAEE